MVQSNLEARMSDTQDGELATGFEKRQQLQHLQSMRCKSANMINASLAGEMYGVNFAGQANLKGHVTIITIPIQWLEPN